VTDKIVVELGAGYHFEVLGVLYPVRVSNHDRVES